MNNSFTPIQDFLTGLVGESIYNSLYFKVILIILSAIVAWLILLFILSFIETRARKYEIVRFSKNFFSFIKKLLGITLFFIAGTAMIRMIDSPMLERIFLAVFALTMAWPINGLLGVVLDFAEKRLADKTQTQVDNIVIDLLNKFASVIVYITAIVMALDILGVNVMPFVAGAGVAGVAIGFAAKDTLSNLIAGVLLLIDRPFEVGDRIEIWTAPAGSSTWGDVTDIGLRATKIRTTDNIDIIIPNNEIMMRDIINYTSSSSSIRVRINIGIAYDADIDTAKQLVIDAANTLDWIQDDPAPKVVVRNFGESSVDLQLRVWIKNARKRMDTISTITDRVKAEFDKAGIEIPFPKRDVTIIHKGNGKC